MIQYSLEMFTEILTLLLEGKISFICWKLGIAMGFALADEM